MEPGLDIVAADRSRGWENIASKFISVRSRIGADVVARWSETLPRKGSVIDIGCGFGEPIAETLLNRGFEVFGIDASPTLVTAFLARFPGVPVACEAAESSRYFDRTFDGAVAIGLLFLVSGDDQRQIIRRVASALKPGGSFLFNAPLEACEWQDMLTGQTSLSLGIEEYGRILDGEGMNIRSVHADSGQNHYLEVVKTLT
jgi:SAM-dependent methyltransferase